MKEKVICVVRNPADTDNCVAVLSTGWGRRCNYHAPTDTWYVIADDDFHGSRHSDEPPEYYSGLGRNCRPDDGSPEGDIVAQVRDGWPSDWKWLMRHGEQARLT